MATDTKHADPFENVIDPFDEQALMDAIQEAAAEGKEADDKDEKDEKPQTEDKEKTKYSQAELLAVYDTLVFDGTYTQVFKARGISAVFRTRSGDDIIKLNQYIDRFQAKSMASLQTYSNMLTLSASLKSVNGKEFAEGDIQAAYTHLKTLPDAVNTLLLMNLSEFDMKVSLAIEEGRKNF